MANEGLRLMKRVAVEKYINQQQHVEMQDDGRITIIGRDDDQGLFAATQRTETSNSRNVVITTFDTSGSQTPHNPYTGRKPG